MLAELWILIEERNLRGKSGGKRIAGWLKGLANQNLQPTMEVIEEVRGNEYGIRERYWIQYYGENLVNTALPKDKIKKPIAGPDGQFFVSFLVTEEMLREIEQAAEDEQRNRSSFIRSAIAEKLKRIRKDKQLNSSE